MVVMGSFSSKMRSSTSDNNETGRRESNSDAKQSGIAEGANSPERTDAKQGGKQHFHGRPSTSSSHGKCAVDERPNQTHSDQKNITEKSFPESRRCVPGWFRSVKRFRR